MPSSRASLLLLERVHLITYTTVEGALYGFTFTLYIFCTRALYLQLHDGDRHRHHLFTLLYMSLVMALAFCEIAVDSQSIVSSYVDHADYPSGGLGYYADVIIPSAIGSVGEAVAILFNLMIYGIQIWRLWVVLSTSQYACFIVVLPILSLCATTVLQVVVAVMTVQLALTPYLRVIFLYALTATQLCTSITITVSICVRIMMIRRKHLRVIGQMDTPSPYTSVISMLIESFALEFVWLVTELGLFQTSRLVGRALNGFFSSTEIFIQLLAYLLVVYRVSTKRGWEQDTGEKLTTLQWNQNGSQTTQISTRVSVPIAHEEA